MATYLASATLNGEEVVSTYCSASCREQAPLYQRRLTQDQNYEFNETCDICLEAIYRVSRDGSTVWLPNY